MSPARRASDMGRGRTSLTASMRNGKRVLGPPRLGNRESGGESNRLKAEGTKQEQIATGYYAR
jgi:hypothetical protein